MKKMMVILLAICLCVGSSACCVKTYTMENFRDNLGDEYEIRTVHKLEVGIYFLEMNLDADDYDIKEGMIAYSNEDGDGVFIVECGSLLKAKKLAKKYDAFVGQYSSGIELDMVTKGSFVLIGTASAVNDALD